MPPELARPRVYNGERQKDIFNVKEMSCYEKRRRE